MVSQSNPPTGLCQAAIKLLRHLQTLPSCKMYVIVLVKEKDRWTFSIMNEQGVDLRVAK